MNNYVIGIDFGTSQTKVCVYNETQKTRKMDVFPDGNIFLPSVIIEDKVTTLFQYGKENPELSKYYIYRYFKMAAAEDADLIQRTYQDNNGKIEKAVDDYRKYSSSGINDNKDIKPEVLVILYLTFVQLYLKFEIESKLTNIGSNFGVFLKSFFRNSDNKVKNSYFVTLGIPTEWNNPNHIKRKVKFQCLLLISKWLTAEFGSLDSFLETPKNSLILKINELSEKLSLEKVNDKSFSIDLFLRNNQLAVFSESAAGLYYLIGTNRLLPGVYATLDIGAGTSDIAMIEITVENEVLYYCSETVAIASNDFYQSLAKRHKKDEITFEQIQDYSKKFLNGKLKVDDDLLIDILKETRGDDNWNGVEGAIMKMFYKPYIELHKRDPKRAKLLMHKFKQNKPILLFGGGSELDIFAGGKYSFFYTQKGKLEKEYYLHATPIRKFVNSLDVLNSEKVKEFIPLLILSMGLTFVKKDSEYVPFEFNSEFEYPEPQDSFDYYDLKYDLYR
jgi:hypothetical protein